MKRKFRISITTTSSRMNHPNLQYAYTTEYPVEPMRKIHPLEDKMGMRMAIIAGYMERLYNRIMQQESRNMPGYCRIENIRIIGG